MKPLPKKSTGTAVNMDGVISLEKVFIDLIRPQYEYINVTRL